ncbi:MAG: sigma-70 family RNA polymerase sigma factor [Deltaproteobacteria bacterium]|nr:sigma-70 family RNA polymerase sigma factor [Deltaproteobacteria bacterium]
MKRRHEEMAPAQDPDADLVRRVREGERAAFDDLVVKYRNRVMGIAVRMLSDRAEAEDVAQDIFVKAYRGLSGFQGEALFSTWLYRIAANGCLNHRKRRRPERYLPADDPALSPPDFASNPQVLVEERQLKLLVEKSIQNLPEEQRIVLILRDIEGLTYEAIAEALAVELGTVRSRLYRARMALQGMVKELVFPDLKGGETL